MSLFSRSADLPGLHGVGRDCRVNAKGLKKLNVGDFAIIDCPDISRAFAQQLINLRPAAVLNISQFSSGVIPNFGPQMLLDAGIILVEGMGQELSANFKDGKKARLLEGGLFYGEKVIATGAVLDQATAEYQFQQAQQALTDHMEAYFGNTIQFLQSEAPLFIDGIGVPSSGNLLQGRKVLIVSPGTGHRTQIKELRNFIREYEPAIIGVDGAADTLVELGYTPDLIVGNPAGIGSEALRSGARVILPAEPDGHAAGLERIQDLGVGAMTFPAAVDSATDLAILLADFHGASLIVNAGSHFDLDAMFAGADTAGPASLLTRSKAGGKLVDARSVIDLYTVRGGGSLAWLWAILGILVLAATIICIAGFSGDGSFNQNLIDTWNNIALSFQDFFKERI